MRAMFFKTPIGKITVLALFSTASTNSGADSSSILIDKFCACILIIQNNAKKIDKKSHKFVICLLNLKIQI